MFNIMQDIQLLYIGQIIALFIISLFIGWVVGPLVLNILKHFSTKNTLVERIINSITVPTESFFFLIIFYLLLRMFHALSDATILLEKYIYAILIIVATFMLSAVSGAVIRWYYEVGYKTAKLKLDLSLMPLFRKISKIIIYIFGFMLALSALGIDITAMIALTSVIGIILGLASQESLANLFAGIMLQIDRPYKYGDFLKLPGTNEIVKVEKIGIRSARLMDMQHNIVIISNSEFAKMKATNLSLPNHLSIIGISAELPHNTNLEKLKEKIVSALLKAKLNGFVPEKGCTLLIDRVNPSNVSFTFSCWVKNYENAFAIREFVNRIIWKFAKEK